MGCPRPQRVVSRTGERVVCRVGAGQGGNAGMSGARGYDATWAEPCASRSVGCPGVEHAHRHRHRPVLGLGTWRRETERAERTAAWHRVSHGTPLDEAPRSGWTPFRKSSSTKGCSQKAPGARKSGSCTRSGGGPSAVLRRTRRLGRGTPSSPRRVHRGSGRILSGTAWRRHRTAARVHSFRGCTKTRRRTNVLPSWTRFVTSADR